MVCNEHSHSDYDDIDSKIIWVKPTKGRKSKSHFKRSYSRIFNQFQQETNVKVEIAEKLRQAEYRANFIETQSQTDQHEKTL